MICPSGAIDSFETLFALVRRVGSILVLYSFPAIIMREEDWDGFWECIMLCLLGEIDDCLTFLIVDYGGLWLFCLPRPIYALLWVFLPPIPAPRFLTELTLKSVGICGVIGSSSSWYAYRSLLSPLTSSINHLDPGLSLLFLTVFITCGFIGVNMLSDGGSYTFDAPSLLLFIFVSKSILPWGLVSISGVRSSFLNDSMLLLTTIASWRPCWIILAGVYLFLSLWIVS